MRDLLSDLQPARRWLWPAVAGVVLLNLLVLGAVVAGVEHGQSPFVRCLSGAAEITAAWNESQKEGVRRAFAGLPASSLPGRRSLEIGRVLDEYVVLWQAMREDACAATYGRGEQSEEALDLRIACLERRVDLEALVATLQHANPEAVSAALPAAHALPAIGDCAELALLRGPLPPDNESARAKVIDVSERISRATAEFLIGHRRQALEAAGPLVQEARELAHGPTLAEALLLAGKAQGRLDLMAAAEASREAALVADVSRHDEMRARAWIELVVLLADRRVHIRDATAAADLARAAVERLNDNGALAADLFDSLGVACQRGGGPASTALAMLTLLAPGAPALRRWGSRGWR